MFTNVALESNISICHSSKFFAFLVVFFGGGGGGGKVNQL